MGDFSVIFDILKEKIMFKNPQIKSNHTVLMKNDVNVHRPLVFASDYSVTGLASKMCTLNAHSVYVIFLWWDSSMLLRNQP